MKASFFTLGCRLNQSETALMANDLQEHGYTIVPWGEPADLVVVNSCTVTASAAQKTRQAARAARKRIPNAFVVLAGCDAVVDPERWKNEASVDLVAPNKLKNRLSELLPDHLKSSPYPIQFAFPENDDTPFIEHGAGLYTDKTRANLKIQEGCNFFCSYCIVPHARGLPVSRQHDDILREAEELIKRGHKELVLSGVNLTTYNDQGKHLPELIRRLLQLGDDFRIRLGSTEPGPVIADLVDLMAETPQLCRFLHLALQYGEDSILKSMNRRYTVDEYANLSEKAVKKVPGICLSSDIIVGFPGETPETFETCCRTIQELPFAFLHIFTYSKRKGTPAANFPNQVPGNTASERLRKLAAIADKKSVAFAESQIGKHLVILPEKRNTDNTLTGWTDNYLKATVAGFPPNADINRLITCNVIKSIKGRSILTSCID